MNFLKFCVIVLLLVIGFTVNQLNWKQIETVLHVIPYACPLLLFTGYQCALCGITHAWIALFRAEFLLSFHFNWLGIPLFLVFIFALFSSMLNPSWSKNRVLSKGAALVFLGGLIIYAVVRNISLAVS